jgi:DNA-binding transcriptional ArsR family regulator
MEPSGYDIQGPGLDATFAALADPTRRAILARLTEGEASVAELAAPFAMSQPAVSKHLKVLERAGLVSRGRDRQRRPVRLEGRPLGEAVSWLSEYRRFWAGRFQRLDALLAELQASAALPVDDRSVIDQGTRQTGSTRRGGRHHQGGHR